MPTYSIFSRSKWNSTLQVNAGDIITITVKEAVPHSMVKKGQVLHAVIVRTKKETRRPERTYKRRTGLYTGSELCTDDAGQRKYLGGKPRTPKKATESYRGSEKS